MLRLLSLAALLYAPCLFASDWQPFLQQHCFECHDADVKKGGLDLTAQSFDPLSTLWVKLHDRVQAGEMPPAKSDPVPAEAKNAFLQSLATQLTTADEKRQATEGRTVLRRLNRVEYETALRDIFLLPLHVQSLLPGDAELAGFDTVGSALNLSAVQMESYMTAAARVIEEATVLYEPAQKRKHRLLHRQNVDFMHSLRLFGPFSLQADGMALYGRQWHSHFKPALEQWIVPQTARYRVTVSASTLRSTKAIPLTVRMGGRGYDEENNVPHTLLGRPDIEPTGKPQVFDYVATLERGQVLRIYPELPPLRFVGAKFEGRQADYTGPGVVIQWVDVEGPLDEAWPPHSHQQLWHGIPTQPMPKARQNVDPNAHLLVEPNFIAKPRMTRLAKADKESGNRMIWTPEQKVGGELLYRNAPNHPRHAHQTLAFQVQDAQAEITRLVKSFLPKAFRRPVTEEEVQHFSSLGHIWLSEGKDFQLSMSGVYQSILCSPGFLYHQATVPSGNGTQLSDHALAERLAFFLWNGLPDAGLLAAAEANTLHLPTTLRQHTERMLKDSRSERFVTNFIGQWLDLRQLDFTTPDPAVYPEYDDVLRSSMEQETHAFFTELLTHDLSVRHVVHSDFAMLNRRLAQHYGLPPIIGLQMQKVALPADSPRGGVLAQASVLKVTANGTNTSPVVRGAWVAERILGRPAPPPPPGIPAIEPDTRGAVTIRQQLEKHRSAASCAACHAKIDPPGLALESFDVIGGWRQQYRSVIPELAIVPDGYSPDRKDPQRYTLTQPVDASGTLAHHGDFTDIRDFKKLVLTDLDQIARCMAEHLIIYATGAPISFADRPKLEQILAHTRSSQHGLRSLIHTIIQSPLFLHR